MSKPALALVVFVGMAVLPAVAVGQPARDPSATMVEQINTVRAERGVPALATAPQLRESTGNFARRIIATDRFAHALPRPARRRFGRVGEILAYHPGSRPRVTSTVEAWLASPPHRTVLLDPSFRFVGAGLASGRLGGVQATAWVARFGS